MTSTRALRALLVALAAALLALVVPATSTAAPCTITFDGGEGTSSWHDAANWTTDAVPGPSDHVCIGNVPVNYSTGDTSILSLQSQGTLELTGGSLSLTDATNASTTVNLTQSGGTIGGAGTLTVSGSFSWSGGTQTDAGTTVIASGATRSIDIAANEVFLSSGRTLRIDSGATASRRWSVRHRPRRARRRSRTPAPSTLTAAARSLGIFLSPSAGAASTTPPPAPSARASGPPPLIAGVSFDNDGTVEASCGDAEPGGARRGLHDRRLQRLRRRSAWSASRPAPTRWRPTSASTAGSSSPKATLNVSGTVPVPAGATFTQSGGPSAAPARSRSRAASTGAAAPRPTPARP